MIYGAGDGNRTHVRSLGSVWQSKLLSLYSGVLPSPLSFRHAPGCNPIGTAGAGFWRPVRARRLCEAATEHSAFLELLNGNTARFHATRRVSCKYNLLAPFSETNVFASSDTSTSAALSPGEHSHRATKLVRFTISRFSSSLRRRICSSSPPMLSNAFRNSQNY